MSIITGLTTFAAYDNISAIEDNAVDIFIYDTSKDSDGGAWRKRTQDTSWYNETLNTSTRGSRKEFPAVAVIVATSTTVTIYDGDTPDLDMWMVFNPSGSGEITSIIGSQTGIGRSISAINAELCLAADGSYTSTALHIVNFVSDTGKHYTSTTTYDGDFLGNIGTRHINANFVTNGYLIINTNVNDVAMTVLPNAPIDSATGLPIPTIAVATEGGVSVIKDDGSVVSQGVSSTIGTHARNISFVGTDQLMVGRNTYGSGNRHSSLIDIAILSSTNYANSAADFVDITSYTGASNQVLPVGNMAGAGCIGLSSKEIAYQDSSGGPLFKFLNHGSSASKGSVAKITSDYNTGYMVGDIKGAWLSDTDTTNVVGSELVTNGTFDSNITGWDNFSGGSIAYDPSNGGRAAVTSINYYGAKQYITVVVGKTYVLTFDAQSGTNNARIRVGDADSGTTYLNTWVSNGSNSFTITILTYTSLRIFLSTRNAADTVYFDNISVRLADIDRSVNANGLAVHGTITKTAVATGADLVGYSGFSTSNYLEQPYNSDLDFGTGDFSFMGWIKPTGEYDNGYIIHRGDAGNGSGLMVIRRGYGGGEFPRIHWGSTGFDYDLIFNKKVTDGVWSFIVVMRSGSTLQTFVNAVSSGETTSSTNISNPNGKLRMGLRMDIPGQAIQGSLALWRISATAPTAEQILEIYNAEKPLFQDGAKCTLNGSSDSVTALDYDDSNDELLVGTSGGLSVFKGLRRVDENTNAITEVAQQGNLRVEEY